MASSKSPIPSRFAARTGAIKGRPAAASPPASAALAAGETPEQVEALEGPQAARRKKIYLIGGVVAGFSLVLVMVLGAVALLPKPPPTREEPKPVAAAVPASQPAVSKESQLEIEKRRELDALRRRLTDDPEQLQSLRADLGSFIPLIEMQKDLDALVQETDKRLNTVRQRILAETRKKSEEYKQKENFEAAAVLWKTPPDIIQRSDLRSKWIEEGEKLASLGAAWALWTKIDAKVDKYLDQDDYDISLAILTCEDNFPRECERRFPEIWKKREERLSDLRVNREKVRTETHDRIVARQEKERQLEIERKRKEREQDWLERLAKTPPVLLISRDGTDLENWSHRPAIAKGENILESRCPWTIQSIDGQQAIVAAGEDEQVELGMNGNRWLDWVFEFEVKVDAGALHLKTRTKIAGQVLFTRITGEAPKQFDFPGSVGGGWTRYRVEARVDKVYIFEGDDKKPKMEIETPDPENQEGGFAFILDSKGAAKLRNATIQLIHDNKRPRDEDEGDE